jgi:hypothetical protein
MSVLDIIKNPVLNTPFRPDRRVMSSIDHSLAALTGHTLDTV